MDNMYLSESFSLQFSVSDFLQTTVKERIV